MHWGYNTNGLAHHRLADAIDLIADLGYRSVAITLDHLALNPLDHPSNHAVAATKKQLDAYGLRSVVETGARFLLDSRIKHEPTLVSSDESERQRRIDFLCRAIDIAAELESDCVSLWSGAVHDGAPNAVAWDRLLRGLRPVLDYSKQRHVPLGFEPEPGMLVETMSQFNELRSRLGGPELRLTLDVGHLHCLGELPIADVIRRWKNDIVNVHIEDMRNGVHEHLMFGDGEIEFGPIVAAFREIEFDGGLHVELSRHSHNGPRAAQRAFEYLTGVGS